MPDILSNAFGSEDSSNSQDSTLVSDLGAAVGLDLDTNSLLGSSNESTSEADQGGLLG